MFIGELVGTFVLVLLNNGVVANVLLKETKGNQSQKWWLISFGAGMAVTMGILVSMGYSKSHLNPAVSIGMFFLGELTALSLIKYIGGQLLGGIFGALAVYVAYKQHFDITDDKKLVLSCFSTSPNIRNHKYNVLTEIISTFILMLGILSIITISNDTTILLMPLLIGILVTVLGVSLGGPTGFAMNPARDLGPRIAHTILSLGDSDWTYSYIPVIGPIIGSLIATMVFILLQSI